MRSFLPPRGGPFAALIAVPVLGILARAPVPPQEISAPGWA
jgi:hypothetical protein